jgi:HlyD family secretion protein
MYRSNAVFACFAIAWFVCLEGCGGEKPPGFAGSGTLEATEVMVSAQTPGQLLRLMKDEGDEVSSGDTLATIDVEKLDLERRQLMATLDEIATGRKPITEAVKQATDNLENIEKTYRRIAALFEKGTATQQQYDDASTKYRLAQSQLESAKAEEKTLAAREATARASIAVLDKQIRDGVVLSPAGGIIAEKYVEPGELVAVGGTIFKVADTSTFWLKIYVAETDLARFKLGDTVRVEPDAYRKPLEGIVSWVSPEAEFTPKNVETKEARAELVYAVKVTIREAPSELKIGMPAEVYLR